MKKCGTHELSWECNAHCFKISELWFPDIEPYEPSIVGTVLEENVAFRHIQKHREHDEYSFVKSMCKGDEGNKVIDGKYDNMLVNTYGTFNENDAYSENLLCFAAYEMSVIEDMDILREAHENMEKRRTKRLMMEVQERAAQYARLEAVQLGIGDIEANISQVLGVQKWGPVPSKEELWSNIRPDLMPSTTYKLALDDPLDSENEEFEPEEKSEVEEMELQFEDLLQLDDPAERPPTPVKGFINSWDEVPNNTKGWKSSKIFHQWVEKDYIGAPFLKNFQVSKAPFWKCQSEMFIEWSVTVISCFVVWWLLEGCPIPWREDICVYETEDEPIYSIWPKCIPGEISWIRRRCTVG